MPIIEPPKTKEDFEKILKSILELQGNPFCCHQMFWSLQERYDRTEAKMKSLNL